jgi:hypothetical protein
MTKRYPLSNRRCSSFSVGDHDEQEVAEIDSYAVKDHKENRVDDLRQQADN